MLSKALRKWCGRNALRHIAVALGLTLMDVLLFLALWKLYLHLFNDLVPSTVKNSDVLLYVSPVLLLSNFMRLEVKPRNDERADYKAKGAAEVIIAALCCCCRSASRERSALYFGFWAWFAS